MPRTNSIWFDKQKKSWVVWLGGKRQTLAKGKKHRRAAESRFEDLKRQAESNPSPEGAQTVASVIERYLSVCSGNLAENTLFFRKLYLQSFAETHGRRLISDCRPDHMEEWLNSHLEWKSDWTKYGAIRNVQVAFNWAAKGAIGHRLIPHNPFQGVSHSVGDSRRDMTHDEFQQLLRATGHCLRDPKRNLKGTHKRRSWKKPTPGARFRQVLIFLWLTGCRPSEACKLRWENVDLQNGVIILKNHKTARSQRKPRPRVIPLDPVALRLLTVIQHDAEYVFVTHKKTPWNKDTLAQRIRRARELVGLPDDATLYGIRHAFGTRGIVSGCDIKTLSTVMGHTTTRMTEHYLHLAEKHAHLSAAMRLINGRRRGA